MTIRGVIIARDLTEEELRDRPRLVTCAYPESQGDPEEIFPTTVVLEWRGKLQAYDIRRSPKVQH